MVSVKLFEKAPEFPEDLQVAKMNVISLAKLASGDEQESKAMFEACQKLGFFLLDLKGDAIGEEMITELDEIFGVIHDTMAVSHEEKLKYKAELPKKVPGYKMEGFMKTETGQQDRCTFYAVLQDDLLGNIEPIDAPTPIRASRALLKSYLEHGQHALSQILAGLEKQLQLIPGTFRKLQLPQEQSGTILRMIRYSPSLKPEDMRTGLLPHTDFGSVTLLANVYGGLQVLMAEDGEGSDEGTWRWVKPQPGTLIINMADAMVEWTGGVLRSPLHRVNYAPGEQRLTERLALAMLVRPNRSALMQRIEGGLIPQLEDDRREGYDSGGIGVAGLTSGEWESKKSEALNKQGKDISKSRGGRQPKTAVS